MSEAWARWRWAPCGSGFFRSGAGRSLRGALGRELRACFFDFARFTLEKVLGALLNLTRLLDAEAGPDRQPVRVFAGQVGDGAVAGFFEQLQRPQTDARHEAQLLALGQRLALPGSPLEWPSRPAPRR